MRKMEHYKTQQFIIAYKICIKKFSVIEIEKRNFHHRKNLILLEDVEKIQVSSMASSGKKKYKYFIGYKDVDYKIQALRIVL